VREQVELYEKRGGKEGTTLRDTGLPVIIVTHRGNKTGAIRKTPLMRVKDGARYVLVGSMGGAPTNPVWVYNLRTNPAVEIRDLTVAQPMRVREVRGCGRASAAMEAGSRSLSTVRGVSGQDHAADPDLRRRAESLTLCNGCWMIARSPTTE